jgi:hypothetical protein
VLPVNDVDPFNNTADMPRCVLQSNEQLGTAEFKQLLSADRCRAVLNCAIKSRDLERCYIDKVKEALKSRKGSTGGKKASSQVLAKKGPLDEILEQLRAHGEACRQDFCDLANVTTADLAAAMSAAEAKLDWSDLEAGNLAIQIISEQCSSCRRV